MKSIIACLFVAFSALANAQLKPFTTDGCSVVPDQPLIHPSPQANSWAHCCIVHDFKYWRGGSRDERLAADNELKNCAAEMTGGPQGNHFFGWVMKLGVRIGGAPEYFFIDSLAPWRWGYGWSANFGYAELNKDQREQVKIGLKEIYIILPELADYYQVVDDRLLYVEEGLLKEIQSFEKPQWSELIL